MNTNENLIGLCLEERYELLEIIGEGGMAVVYKALDRRLNRYVAVKVMRPEMAADQEFRQRFFAESQAVAMLSSPNIVAVYDVSHSADIEYIVMELVDGISLKQYMERKGPIPWREVIYFARQIARALAHAHARGIVHRDIKPQNMMLLRDGTLKVGDFGIAALENEMQEERGTAIGSIHYIAPEQARGESPDARSDLYSLGVVMYEMLTGEKPYTGETLGEIAVKHMNTVPVPPHEKAADIPPELEYITLKAMNADILLRYQSAAELIQDLDRFQMSQTQKEEEAQVEQAAPSVVPVRSVSELSKDKYRRRRRRSGRVSYMIGTFGVLLCAVGLFVFLFNYFLKDLFSETERVELPDFRGRNYEEILKDPQNTIYSFEIVLLSDSATTVERQEPSPGTRATVDSSGIPVRLYVSSDLAQVPDVYNMDYREATALMRVAGYYVEIVDELSDSYTRNRVMNTSPAAGTELSPGSVVYLTVSAGPEILTVNMPNLVGLSEIAAIQKIEGSNLSYGGSEYMTSDLPVGTVIGQSVDAFSEIAEHSKVTLRVSTGPEEA